MDPTIAPAIESSPNSNLEVTPSITSSDSGGDMDWASRLDSAMESINQDTGATKHGKIEKTPKSNKSEPVVNSDPEPNVEVDSDPDSEDTPEETKVEKPNEESAPANLTDKAKVKWGELRSEAAKAKEYAKEIETLKSELEKTKSVPVESAEVERLRQINAEYEQELSIARVEATQEYKSNVVEPMVSVVGYLNSLASKYELNSKEMLAAFSESDPAKQSDLIADIAASMNERDRLRFYASSDDYSEIMRRRDIYQTNSRERTAQIEQQRQAEINRQKEDSERSVTESRQAYEKATSKVFADLKKQVSVLSHEEVAADVQRLAKGDYSNANPELKSYLAHAGALLPHLLKSLKEAQAKLEKSEKTISGYRNSSPKAGSGSSESSRTVPTDVGFLEALDQQLG